MGISLWHFVVVSLALSVPAMILSIVAFVVLGQRRREAESLFGAAPPPEAKP